MIPYKTLTNRMLAIAAAFALTTAASAATINFSSLETVLAAPTDMNSKMTALWTGWSTQVYEYNMPFIQLGNESDAPFAIDEFRMSIGDTNYGFSNVFFRKEETNSYPYPANGEYAITGFSTPDIEFDTRLEEGGDVLVVDFGARGGLKPGEVVRFQVDIDRDDDNGGMMRFADYTSVFFTPNGGADTTGNSELSLTYIGTNQTTNVTLPNYPVSAAVAGYLQTPRPYAVMQPIDVYPDTPFGFEEIPEPTTALMAALGLVTIASRRRG
ncbi:hypothetical protein Pla108_28180 [Botrimarina colliarenosi]|uniref:Ice-binding protein C-terminal domain-containing protein n=1 Tax=Botrimarina colliarenosi TaxID=2528001 RepID=A0A5C6ADA2_9BACT|nr:PEP-CTERM sorting domain-containing protein [Botrimarina colliarenosi]TWT97041.1 hypothetical protein Pla108_28180 [Botrimarina colliarenosi]